MTNAQLYDLILVKARRAGDSALRAVIAAELRGMLNSLERSPFHPWFLETISSGVVTVADEETVVLPSNYLLLVEDAKVYAISEAGVRTKITRSYHEDIEEANNGLDPGVPSVYDIFANKFYFGPTPDGIYTIRFKYYAATTPPPDDAEQISNPWALDAEDFFVVLSAQRLVQNYIKDYNLAGALAAEASGKRVELHKYNEARKHVDMDYEVDR